MKFLLFPLLLLLASCGGGDGIAGPTVVAFYGDSITTGTRSTSRTEWSPVTPVPSIVQQIGSIAHVDVIDYSVNGASAVDWHVHDDASSVVVIRYGVANSVYGTSSAAFSDAITRLITEARALGKTPVLTGLPYADVVDTGPLDDVMRERSHSLGVRFVDLRALPYDSTIDSADGLHPSAVYAERIIRLIAEALVGT